MSVASFPKMVDPLKMVDQRVDLQGWILLKQLDRVQDYLLDNSGAVEVKLRFDKDEMGVRFIAGVINAKVSMQCQRCLQAVEVKVNSDLSLGIVFSEDAAKNLPGYYDPLLSHESALDLWKMVEEEMILGLPIAAVHQEGECEFIAGFGDCTDETERLGEKPANPFQILQQLKDKN